MTTTIPLTRGLVALIDPSDLERLSRWTWKAVPTPGGNVYAARLAPPAGAQWKDGSPQLLYMHRELLGLAPGRDPVVDHRNRNTLDNQRTNLRLSTYSLNMGNRPMQGNRHGYKGVVFEARFRRYRAEVYFERRRYRSGWCRTAEECALAYDVLARQVFGEFACTNFNQDGSLGPAVTEAKVRSDRHSPSPRGRARS